MSGANIGSKVLQPGQRVSIASIASQEPRPMFAAAWPDYGFGANSPSAAELALTRVAILIDEAEQTDALGNLTVGNPVALPARGIRRAVGCFQMSIVVSLDRTATRNMSVRAHCGFGTDNAEELNAADGIFQEGGGTLFIVPRFATKFRVWDWGGGASLSFTDLAGNLTGLPQDVIAGQFPDWTPLPPATGAIIQTPSTTCTLQFGRF